MDSPAISSVLMGYTPLIDRQRNAIGVRIPIIAPAGGAMPRLAALYTELSEALQLGVPPALLAVQGDTVSSDVLICLLNPDLWLELPAPFVCTAEGESLATELMRAGFRMVLRDRPPRPIAEHLLPGFKLSMINYHDDMRLRQPPGQGQPTKFVRSIAHAQSGITTIGQMEAAFANDAAACIGWPWDDALQQASRNSANPDVNTVSEMITLVDRGANVEDLERVLKRDASLAYRLLRYMNSAAFGLSVEITSFRHALMILGNQKLKRWLALLLSNASKEANLRPVMFASFRRGVFLEQLVGTHGNQSMRDEVFILGVFSLLDKLFRLPFAKLFETLRVSENVYETLVERRGPYMPYLRIAENIERGPTLELEDLLNAAVLSVEQCNRALIKTLAVPDLARMAS